MSGPFGATVVLRNQLGRFYPQTPRAICRLIQSAIVSACDICVRSRKCDVKLWSEQLRSGPTRARKKIAPTKRTSARELAREAHRWVSGRSTYGCADHQWTIA